MYAVMYSTMQEKRFLAGLGNFGPNSRDHCKLLKKYHEAAASRKDWADIDKTEIIEHVIKMIGDEISKKGG